MVQLLTEIDVGHPLKNSAYRKNVEMARKIFETIPTDKYKYIFRKNWKEISNEITDLEPYFIMYKREREFLNKLRGFLNKVSKIVNVSGDEIYNKFKTLSVENTIEMVINQINEYIPEDMVQEYLEEFNQIVDSTINEYEKRLT